MTPRQRKYHIWMPDERSLCDQRAHATASPPEEGEMIPTCGACLIVADAILGWAASYVHYDGVPQESPKDAYNALMDTRWSAFSEHLEWARDRAMGDGYRPVPIPPNDESQPAESKKDERR